MPDRASSRGRTRKRTTTTAIAALVVAVFFLASPSRVAASSSSSSSSMEKFAASSANPSQPPPPEGDVTDEDRDAFASRDARCAACQRLVLHLDENLLPRAFDERARADASSSSSSSSSSSGSSSYGRYEAIVEEEVSNACAASAIQLSPRVRRACRDILDAHEDLLVDVWYRRVIQEEDWNMNWGFCATSGGLLAPRYACADAIARLETPQLEALEQHAKLEGMRQPESERLEGTKPKYQSQPSAEREPRAGEIGVVVGADFHRRVVADDAADALVYFAFPTANPNIDAATVHVLSTAAKALCNDTDATVTISRIDAERNEVPHPYGSHVSGPTVMLFPAGRKHKPRLLRMRGEDSGSVANDDPEAAPTLGDVLYQMRENGGDPRSRARAGEAMIRADAGELEGEGRAEAAERAAAAEKKKKKERARSPRGGGGGGDEL